MDRARRPIPGRTDSRAFRQVSADRAGADFSSADGAPDRRHKHSFLSKVYARGSLGTSLRTRHINLRLHPRREWAAACLGPGGGLDRLETSKGNPGFWRLEAAVGRLQVERREPEDRSLRLPEGSALTTLGLLGLESESKGSREIPLSLLKVAGHVDDELEGPGGLVRMHRHVARGAETDDRVVGAYLASTPIKRRDHRQPSSRRESAKVS